MKMNEPEKISKHRFILFYGPSCSGKTYYYSKQLCHSHRCISSEDLFMKDPALGCRGVGLRIVSLLQQGHNVVLDDENYKIQTRRSYYTLIKKKVPDCSLLCLRFVAKYGNFQVQWLSEHCMVEAGLAHIPCNRTQDLNKWLDGVQDVPDESTEQCKVEEIVSMPTIQSFYEFNVPGLIIERCSLFSGGDEDVIQPALLQEIESWTHSYPDGRLIIVKTDIGNSYEDIKGKLMKLAKKVDTPVVAILLKGKFPFRTPPQPGLIAVLQRFLHLDIHCTATMYVYSTNQHKECAINAGVRHIKVKSQCAVQPIVPKMFSDFMLTPPIGERKKYSVENEMLPLYEEARVNAGFAKLDLDEDCTVYLAASNEALDRYQYGITKWVQKTPSDGCKITETSPKVVKPTISPNETTMDVEPTSLVNLTRTGSLRNLPKWMYTRSKDTPKTSKKRLRETTKKTPSVQCSIVRACVKAMNASELTDNAKHILQENNKPCLDGDNEPGEITILIDKPTNTNPVSEVSLEGNVESTCNSDELTRVVDTGELNEIDSRTTLAPASIEEESYIDSILECKAQNGTSFQNNGDSKMETLESQSPEYDKGANGAKTPVSGSGATHQGQVDDDMIEESQGKSEKLENNSNIYESEYYLDTLPMFREESQRPLKPPPKRKLTSPREDSNDPRVLKSKTKKKFTSPREDSNNPCVVESQGSSEKLKNNSNKCESEHYLDTLPMFREESQRPLKPPPKRKFTSPREDTKDPRVQKSKTKYMSANSSYLDDLGL